MDMMSRVVDPHTPFKYPSGSLTPGDSVNKVFLFFHSFICVRYSVARFSFGQRVSSGVVELFANLRNITS